MLKFVKEGKVVMTSEDNGALTVQDAELKEQIEQAEVNLTEADKGDA